MTSNPSKSGEIKFGTDGWRGIIADDFTFPNVRKVTRAIASYLETAYSQDRPVLIAYDTRFLADEFARTSAQFWQIWAGMCKLLIGIVPPQ